MYKKIRPVLISLSILVAFILILTAAAFSQTKGPLKQNPKENNINGKSIITGVIADSLTKKPIAYVNFVLYRYKDSTLFNGAATDTTGRFTLSNIPKGAYYARISAVGYKARKRNLITLSYDGTLVDLDTIRLLPKSISTQAVQITAEKENVVFEEDKIIVNVNRSMGNNAAEVLENTPMVNVDIDGRISLPGKPGTTIYIDGIPAKYSGFEKADDLKLISAGDIEKIEIIMNPSVEYSERNEAGIINIITKKKPATKYSGYSGLEGNTRNQFDLNLGLSYRYKDFFVRGNYSNDYSKYNSGSTLFKTVTLNDEVSHLTQTGSTDNEMMRNLMNLNLGYNIDEKNILNSGISYNMRNSENHKLLESQLSGSESGILDNFETDNLTDTKQSFFSYYLRYNRQFAEKGRHLSVMFSYFNNSMNMTNNIDKTDVQLSESIRKHNTSDNSNNTMKWGIMYVHPFGKEIKFDVGYSVSYKKLGMNNIYSDYDDSERRFKELLSQRLESRHKDIVQYFYGYISGILWQTNYSFGLSAEMFKMANEEQISRKNYVNNFLSAVPSVSLSKKLFNKHELSLAYSRLSSLPENKQLNPHIDYTDSTNLEAGNPNLVPYYTSAYYIGYQIANKDLVFKAGAAYYDKKDIIEKITTQMSTKAALTTYKNLTSSRTYNAYIYAGRKIYDWLQIDPRLDYYKKDYSGINIKNSAVMWSAGLRSVISRKNFRFQVDFKYLSPEIDAQSKNQARYYANAAMKVLFFDKSLSLTLRAQDIFNTINQKRYTSGIGFSSHNSLMETTRIISLGISYYFQSKAEDSIEEPEKEEAYDDF